MFRNNSCCLVLALCYIFKLTLAIPQPLRAEEVAPIYAGEVTGERVNIRAGANITQEVVCTISKGEQLFVLEEQEEWVRVLLPDKASVWIHSSLIDRQSDRLGTVNKDGVNVRISPNINSTLMGQMNKGDEVELREEKFEWLRIKAPVGSSGWISKQFFKKTMDPEQFKESQRQKEVQKLYQDMEKIYSEELLKPLAERDSTYLLEQYRNMMTLYDGIPEATLAEHRYYDVLGWKAEAEWVELEVRWQAIINDPQKAKEAESFSDIYSKFVENYPKTTYAKIAEDRLQILTKQRTIDAPLDLAALQQEASEEVTFSGVIYDLGKLVNRPATHKLMQKGHVVCLLRSDKVPLKNYIYRKATLKGHLVQVKGWDIPILVVGDIDVKSWEGRY